MPQNQPFQDDARQPDREASLQALLASHAGEGLAMVDPKSGVTVAGNPAFRRVCGLGPGEEICFADLLVEPSAGTTWRQVLTSGPVSELRPARIHLRLPGGALRLVEVRLAWVTDLGRDLVAVALHDLSHEERLAGMASQGRRLRSLGRLASSLVHRFNNLLGVVTGYAGQLQGCVGEGREEQALRQILTAGQDAARLGAGIARVMGGLEVSSPGPFDLNTELRILRDILEKLAQKRRIEFLLDAPEGLFTFGRAELLRDLLLEVTMHRFLTCSDQGRFTIRLEKEAGLFSAGSGRGRGWLCLSWQGVPLAPVPVPIPLGSPPEWPSFLAEILGCELEESHQTGEARLHLPWYDHPGRKMP